MTKKIKTLTDELVRDLTKVGGMAKSEVRRRLQDYRLEIIKEIVLELDK